MRGTVVAEYSGCDGGSWLRARYRADTALSMRNGMLGSTLAWHSVVDRVGAGVFDGFDLSLVDAGQGMGAQRVADKGRAVRETLEGGVVRQAHVDQEGHGR